MSARKKLINAHKARKRRLLLFIMACLCALGIAACGVQIGNEPYITENNVGPHSPQYKGPPPEQNVELRAYAQPAAPRPKRYTPKETYSPASALLHTARSQIGASYRYGGSTPREGFDCSGLIYWAYRQHGVSMPRMAKVQSGYGDAIKQSNLKPGDIVAFRIGKTYHTGIYSGSGKFIHSPRKGQKVREESMRTAYWQRHYIGARRVI